MIKKFIPYRFRSLYHKMNQLLSKKKELYSWYINGKPSPPPHKIKEKLIRDFAKTKSINTLVETGTYKGEMIYSQLKNFKHIFSIELNDALFDNARTKFSKFNHVKIIHGDSAFKLKELLQDINTPCVFWLDGHYDYTPVTSKGIKVSPIFEELESIAQHKQQHAILIDDARLFTEESEYPSKQELYDRINQLFSNPTIRETHDVFVVTYDC